ncbi:hypothetical protein G7077_09530 [Sphingomonas piscis]|uniref:Uncharacterized protein n=1 Tax=Sphingomonas piscis TaxID=2714943 RepID=A0A6G7YQT2_9SPHN|nr:hypothetical protein [Sphingomonas piscis]QIK79101.1 hypothetical protein G7077_09530 [Sphingomonas piscis]
MKSLTADNSWRDLKADLTIEVVTSRKDGDLAHLFRATELIVSTCTKLVVALFPGAPLLLQPRAILEDLGSRSVISWIRLEENAEDTRSQTLGEAAVGNIVDCLRWLSDCRAGVPYQELLRIIGEQRAANNLPIHLNAADLLASLGELQEVRATFPDFKRILFTALAGDVKLDASSYVPVGHLLQLAAHWHLKNTAVEIVLVVQEPDYSGGRVWKMQHNGTNVEVAIHDQGWLSAFSNRGIDVRKGDIVRAIATTEQHYGVDGVLLHGEIHITAILETVSSGPNVEGRTYTNSKPADISSLGINVFWPLHSSSPDTAEVS